MFLDYADVLYDQPSNSSFSENIESFQHSAALAITEAKNLHQELGVEYHYQKDGWEDRGYFIKFFQLFNQLTFIIYYLQWEILIDILIHLIQLIHLIAVPTISRTLLFQMSLLNVIVFFQHRWTASVLAMKLHENHKSVIGDESCGR